MNPWIILYRGTGADRLGAVGAPFSPERAFQAFSGEWVAILERNIGVYRKLPMPLRLQSASNDQQFLHQKNFSGAGGLEVTDEMRVTIAAQACMLQLNRNSGLYPGLKYIIIYPSAFVVTRHRNG